MKWAKEISFCKKCKKVTIPTWLSDKRSEWLYMDYPYESFRPIMIRFATKELCPKCQKDLIEAVDRANDFRIGYLLDRWEAPNEA